MQCSAELVGLDFPSVFYPVWSHSHISKLFGRTAHGVLFSAWGDLGKCCACMRHCMFTKDRLSFLNVCLTKLLLGSEIRFVSEESEAMLFKAEQLEKSTWFVFKPHVWLYATYLSYLSYLSKTQISRHHMLIISKGPDISHMTGLYNRCTQLLSWESYAPIASYPTLSLLHGGVECLLFVFSNFCP